MSGVSALKRLFARSLTGKTHGSGMKTYQVTSQEARALARRAERGEVSGAERRYLQSRLEEWGGRFDRGALAIFERLGTKKNPVSSISSAVRRAGGRVDSGEMARLLRRVRADGITDAERHVLVREVLLRQLSPKAARALDQFRRAPGLQTKQPLADELPARPGDGRHRVLNRNPGSAGRGTEWFPIAEGTPIKDGEGQVLRTLGFPAPTSGTNGTPVNGGVAVRVNFGQRKVIDGVPHVLAFASKAGGPAVTGWVPEKAIDGGRGVSMPTVNAPRPKRGDGGERWKVGAPVPPEVYGLKTKPNQGGSSNEAGHYLPRNGRINLTWDGVVTSDLFPVGSARFRPASPAKRRTVPLFRASSPARAGSLELAYGRFEDKHGNVRHGWVTRAVSMGESRWMVMRKV